MSTTLIVQFGPFFGSISRFLAASNLDFVSFLPVDCIAPMDHHDRLLVWTLGVLFLDAVLMLVYKAAAKDTGRQVLTALFLVNSLLLPQVSMTIFSTFPRTEFDGDYGIFLTVDKSIDWNSARHTWMMAYVDSRRSERANTSPLTLTRAAMRQQ